ncbi:Diaphanous GTPase-binding Domain family protein [Aspergillus niger]|uniref:Diaphanous GTPase-binding Domain family protein n=1 Tax=Aspergillus niger TaxID=5061 RepID=A0A505HYA7_ASPNG|nr:Diaphanous GTPase-binding Domain family protein [Aspergillus niger]
MSSAEESPAQRAARLRRERREAKIKGDGAARLDKITSLSGRTPASPPQQQQELDPETLQAQQELFRALLRQSGQPGDSPSGSPGPQPGGPGGMGGMGGLGGEADDPTLKLLSSLMAGDTSALGEGSLPGGQSPADLLTGLGVPPFVASMLGEATRKKSDEEKREILVWKVLHVVFSVLIGVYLLVLIGSSVATFGSQPPPPATARNPFLFFTTGEVVLTGARVMMKRGGGGLGLWVQLVRDIARDGSIVLFLFGMANWWHREWTAN